MNVKSLLPLAIALLAAPPVRADFAEYYIARDLRETIPTGTYAGLDNPNFNRLTLLYAHTYPDDPGSNHYHAKGVYTYTGPNLGAATAVTISPSNFLPESGPPLQLLPGSGAFAGSWISGLTPGVPFSDLELRSVDSLAGYAPGTPEWILFNSGGNTPSGRWAGSLAGSNLALELVSATSGLSIATADGTIVLSNPGDRWSLGEGGASLAALPILVASTYGLHSATFKIVDTGTGNNGGPWGESGLVTFHAAAVPEPGALSLGLLGLVFGWAGRVVARRLRP